jgi:outer membrane protein assembly factor BamB
MNRFFPRGCLRAPAFFLFAVLSTLPAVAAAPRLLWRTPLPAEAGIPLGTPATDGRRLYAVAGGVRAWDLQTGEPLWTAPLAENAPRNVAVDEGRVFVAETVAMAFDAATGRELWRFTPDANASLGRSTAADGAFYFGTASHRLYALHATDGTPIWSIDLGLEWTYPAVVRGVTVADDTAYAAVDQWRSAKGETSAGWLIALDRKTGAVRWRCRHGEDTGVWGASAPPVVAGNLILANDYLGNTLFAVDRLTGKEIWTFAGDRNRLGFPDPPAVHDGKVYAASGDTFTYALDLTTGRQLWKLQLPAGAFAQAACGGALFVNYQGLATIDVSEGKLVDRRLDGEEEFLSSGFAVWENRIYGLGARGVYGWECPLHLLAGMVSQ